MIKAIEYLKCQLKYVQTHKKNCEGELVDINERRNSSILEIDTAEITIRHFKQAIKKLETGE